MSALQAEKVARTSREHSLHPVPKPVTTLARTPFLVFLALVLGLGMVGLVMLQTTVQQQSFEVRRLEAEASALAYQEAQLQAEVDRRATPAEIARRATELGMVPNPYPAFIDVRTGAVTGVAKPVTGQELPNLHPRTASRPAPSAQPGPPPPAEPGDAVAPSAAPPQQAPQDGAGR
ncbi:MAG: hypothetical protein Q4G45_00765 [Actinomycetia bacterium]|nr:hypothetical protein [Actinomycetes bacterium]